METLVAWTSPNALGRTPWLCRIVRLRAATVPKWEYPSFQPPTSGRAKLQTIQLSVDSGFIVVSPYARPPLGEPYLISRAPGVIQQTPLGRFVLGKPKGLHHPPSACLEQFADTSRYADV